MPRIRPQLPIEILESELLPRLPAKSLGRFRCVCKSWNSILSTPTFARFHLNYQTNYKLLLLDNPRITFHTIDWDDSITRPPNPFKEDMFILASLDGLVCVALDNTRELAFWNPLTGAYKKFKTSFYDDICDNTAFAFYTDSSNDYKLMHIVSEGAFIYSRRLDLWRKIDTCLDISQHGPDIHWSMDVVLEGKVYFKMETTSPRVISFDVESEKFKEIQLPPFYCGANFDGVNLVALNGCIHLYVCYTDNAKGLKCDMWRMNGDGWMKAAVFSRPDAIQFHEHIHTKRNGEWLVIWKDNNSIKNIDLEDFATNFRYYDPLIRWFCERVGAVYIETLVSPNP